MPHVRRSRRPRPRFATLVRLRQELTKRLDSARGAADRVDGGILPTLLRRDDAAALGVARHTSGGLRNYFAARSLGRFPLAHLAHRDRDSLPARAELLALAEQALAGKWSVFGTPVKVDGRSFPWTRHPVTGAATDATHWRLVRYMSGVGGGDVKFIWELNRHAPLVRLAQGYFLTGDERFAERAVELIDDWVQGNPPARGINWASSLEVAFRAISWCWIWALTCQSPAWTDERLSRFLVSLWHHAHHIDRYDSTHHSPNTHLTGEALGLLYVGSVFPELAGARRWVTRGRAILLSELHRQLFRDGMHFERSVGYHRYTAEFYLHLLLLARASGTPLGSREQERVRSLVAASWLFRRPDGSWPVIGDEDSGSTLSLAPTTTHDHAPILAVGAAVFGDGTWLCGVTDAARASAWWLLDDELWESLAALRPATADTSEALVEAGYLVAREHGGEDAWFCIVDAGPHGGDATGHAHTDLGHVEIARGSTHIVADPGCSTYTIDTTRRDWFRSEVAHACLVIDGAPLAEPSGPFSWARTAPSPDVMFGEGAGSWWCELCYDRPGRAHAVRHRRQVVMVRGWGVLVADWVDGADGDRIALHWPIPSTDCTLVGERLENPAFGIAWMASPSAGEPEATLAVVSASPAYGREVEARQLRVRYGGAPSSWMVTGFAEPGASVSARDTEEGAIRCDVEGAKLGGTVLLRPGVVPAVRVNVRDGLARG